MSGWPQRTLSAAACADVASGQDASSEVSAVVAHILELVELARRTLPLLTGRNM
ncbi:MAG: hypothetical protein QOG62_2478 [Thermoleophilaceae bacterium]|jgi:hypothetical protein|nr:hypothetical protein [Thermoleophilaceae bacterium]